MRDGLEEVAVARAAVPKARERLAAAIVTAYREGQRVGEIARITGYSRERIRQIIRDGES